MTTGTHSSPLNQSDYFLIDCLSVFLSSVVIVLKSQKFGSKKHVVCSQSVDPGFFPDPMTV